MNLDINSPLIIGTPENTYPAEIEKLKETYGEDKVEEAIKYLTYKEPIPPLHKEENPNHPTLYVFRHGQSNDNTKMIFSGWRSVGLTDKGKEGALAIAEMLKDKNIDMLFSSDQPRTYETMKLAMSKNEKARNLEINVDHRLRERNYGDWQGYSKLEKHLEDSEKLLSVRRGWDTPPPNGESMAMVNKRVTEFLEELIPMMKEKKINVAVACSGNSIRPIRKRLENLTNEEAATIETPTGKDYAAYTIK